jgi:hypothetical protein
MVEPAYQIAGEVTMLHVYPLPVRLSSAVLACVLLVAASPAEAQAPSSPGAAADLTRLLDNAKLESIATVDPEDPNTWIAALYFKDSQLLVVSAQYAAPTLLAAKMKDRDFRDIYLALFSSGVSGTKIWVMDTDANGLMVRPNGNAGPDMWEIKGESLMFDGEWRRAKMSEGDYRKSFADADERYTRMLRLLIGQLKGNSGT